jgi:hypothetical protein
MAETEQTNQRPSCGYKVEKTIKGADGTDIKRTLPCGSEEGLRTIHGRGTWGGKKDTPVCKDHFEKAWGRWNVDSAD